MAQVVSPYSSVPAPEWSWKKLWPNSCTMTMGVPCSAGAACKQRQRMAAAAVMQRQQQRGSARASGGSRQRTSGQCHPHTGSSSDGLAAAAVVSPAATALHPHPEVALNPSAALKAAITASVGQPSPAAQAGRDQVHPAGSDE